MQQDGKRRNGSLGSKKNTIKKDRNIFRNIHATFDLYVWIEIRVEMDLEDK